MASAVEGIYFPASIALIVWRETFTRCANSSWVMLRMARSTRILFCMGLPLGVKGEVQHVVEAECKEDQDGKHVVDHHIKEL